jgi:hypothetical protein
MVIFRSNVDKAKALIKYSAYLLCVDACEEVVKYEKDRENQVDCTQHIQNRIEPRGTIGFVASA